MPHVDVSPPSLAPLSDSLRMTALLIIGIGLITAASGVAFGGHYALLIERCGSVLGVYGLMVLLGGGAGAGWLRKQLTRVKKHGFSASARGYYGLAALAIFVHSEATDVLRDVLAFELAAFRINDLLVPYLIGFSLESLMNAIWASLWPIFLFSKTGVISTVIFAAIAWLVFAVGGQFFPHHMFADLQDVKSSKATSTPPPPPVA